MAEGIEIISNKSEVGLRIRLFAGEVSHEIRNLTDEIAEKAVDELQNFAPHGHTGDLQRSFIKGPVVKRGPEYIARVVSTSDYAQAVDKGSGRWGPKGKPIVAPAGNAFLLIKDPRPGRHSKEPGVVFTKVVQGQKPQYFIEKAEASVSAFMRPIVEETLGRPFHT